MCGRDCSGAGTRDVAAAHAGIGGGAGGGAEGPRPHPKTAAMFTDDSTLALWAGGYDWGKRENIVVEFG